MEKIKCLLAACLFTFAGTAAAQQLSLKGGSQTYSPDAPVTITYSGASQGGQVLLYHNASLFPLKQKCQTDGAQGDFTASGLLPGSYRAVLTDASGAERADVSFSVADYPLPKGKRIFVISDPHVMAPELVEDPTNERYLYIMSRDRKLMPQSYELFAAALDSARALHPDLLIIVGDMTKDGERASHELVAACLQQLAYEGIPSLVIPGNHDLECIGSLAFTAKGERVTDNVSLDEFTAIYQNFGWGTESERDPHSLSYAVDIFDGVRFIGIDDCRIPSRGDTAIGIAEYGRVNPATIDWVLEQADKAREEGKVVIAAIHHQLIQHYVGQERLMASAATEHGDSIARLLADHGIRVALTGHMHMPSVSRIRGFETDGHITEISMASTVTYPSQYRILTLSDDLASLSVDTRYIRQTASIDDVLLAAREKVESTLSKSIAELVPRYLPTFNQMLAGFASDPVFAEVLSDVPQDTDELARIAYLSFAETMKKVLFTLSEGDEQLKDAEEGIFEQLRKDCETASDLIFDQQTPDTRAFLALTMYYFMLDYAENPFHSMFSDTSYWGTELADQTDDLYLTVDLKGNGSGIQLTQAGGMEAPLMVCGIDGIVRHETMENLPRGIYVVRQGGKTYKIVKR